MKSIVSHFFEGIFLLGLITALGSCEKQVPREKLNFGTGWKFALVDDKAAVEPGFDDSEWRLLDLPHDWSIEGTFSKDHPATTGGGALPGGIGWYRKAFHLDTGLEGKQFYLEFDGIYRNSEVWINGHYLGKRPYGYISFRYEVTPWLHFGNQEIVVAVRVDNSQQPNSRWYSGSGIYRNIWLVSTGPVAVDHWGTFVTTPEMNEHSARMHVETRIRNSTGNTETVTLETSVYDRNNHRVASTRTKGITLTDTVTVVQHELTVEEPQLWSVDDPSLYRVVSVIMKNKRSLDVYETVTGIRSFRFDPEKGFFLNGNPMKIQGVCEHHDLGCLGASINTRAIERRLEILKDMGCNAIRTAHNPPSPELLDLCDRMGFLVMDEAFDMWKISKTKFDYSRDWDKWHRKDLEDMVLRDRNHPSVIIWSIGNEVMEQWDSTGTGSVIATRLAAIVRQLDNTRPITSGCNYPEPKNPVIQSGALDLIGYNYHHETFPRFLSDFPGQAFIATETTSALATRGSYDMPSDSVRRWPVRWDIPFTGGNPDYSCSSYDNCSAPWGSTHRESLEIIKKYEFLSGMFIWTGFDYLGEPTPYGWPARSSYFGIIDLCGFPKDAYYLYQSEWTNTPVLHLFPHWNWKPGQEVDVWVYTNCKEAELFLNDSSLGKKQKTAGDLHLMWRVPFEEGTLMAVGITGEHDTLVTRVKTAGEPARLVLDPDRNKLAAGGSDLSFITATVKDQENNTVPLADNLVRFSIEGDAAIAGVDNGSQTSHEPFQANSRRAFHGKCLLVIRAGSKKGTVTVKATSEGLETAECVLKIE